MTVSTYRSSRRPATLRFAKSARNAPSADTTRLHRFRRSASESKYRYRFPSAGRFQRTCTTSTLWWMGRSIVKLTLSPSWTMSRSNKNDPPPGNRFAETWLASSPVRLITVPVSCFAWIVQFAAYFLARRSARMPRTSAPKATLQVPSHRANSHPSTMRSCYRLRARRCRAGLLSAERPIRWPVRKVIQNVAVS